MTEPWAHRITVARVHELHEEGLRRYGGDPGLLDANCPERCVANAWQAEMYQDDEGSGGLLFAAYLLFYVCQNHCFVDGNKRVAWLCMLQVLATHDLSISATDDEAEAFMYSVAEGATETPELIATWLAVRLIGV
jgi:death-on-curing protein